jgi:hypothetical protein
MGALCIYTCYDIHALKPFNLDLPHTHTYSALQDIVERFELLLVLGFVVVEDITSGGGGWVPTTAMLLVCGRIFLWEVRTHNNKQQNRNKQQTRKTPRR